MRIEIDRDDRGYRYRLVPESDDRDAGTVEFADRPDRDVRRVGDRYRVDLPEGTKEPHPDHHALAIWCAVRPYVGRRLDLPFPVSSRFAVRARRGLGVEFSRSSADVAPWTPPGDAPPALMFSGGTDSLAAGLLMPPDTVHLVLDRISRIDRFDATRGPGTIDQADLRAVCADVAAAGRRVFILRDDHEALTDPYPTWHTNVFVLPALYLARTLGIGAFDSGDVLDAVYIGGYHDGTTASWGFRGLPRPPGGQPTHRGVTDFLAGSNPLGLRRVESIRGLSAVATSAIVARSPFQGRAYSCYRPAAPNPYGRFCMQCDKCFMKLLLALVAQGRPVPGDLFEAFLAQPHLAAIFQRPFLDWHHLWFYLFQRMECDHWFVDALRRQARRGPDLSFLERWYPRAADGIPQAYRRIMVSRILDHVATMTEAEVERLEHLALPPLEAPRMPRRRTASGPRTAAIRPEEASVEGWDVSVTVVAPEDETRSCRFGIGRHVDDGPAPFRVVKGIALYYRGTLDGERFEAAASLLQRVMASFERPPDAVSTPEWRRAILRAIRTTAQGRGLDWRFDPSAGFSGVPGQDLGEERVVPGYAAVVLGADPTREASHVAINTTVRCQQRCAYCFEGDRAGKADLPSETVRQMLLEAAGVVGGVMFMGAEPTLNPDLPELTRYARDLGLWVGYSTNALRFRDAGFLRTCVTCGLKAIELSFCYPDADVYHEITGMPPAAFRNLLTALDQIEMLNAERAAQGMQVISVAVNCVVSLANVERLDAVVGHLRSRFRSTQWSLSLKRVGVGHLPDDKAAAFHVPLGSLRRVFGALPADLEAFTGAASVRFRDFPLCALPGHEHREANVASLREGTPIQNNFGEQLAVRDMYPEEGRWHAHPFSWWCSSCGLRVPCVFRGVFLAGGDEAARPVPFPEPLDEGLRRRMGGDAAFAPVSGGMPRADSDGGVEPALVALLAAIEGCGGRSPDGRHRWIPLRTGVVRLAREGACLEVGCGRPPEDGTPFFTPARDVAVWPLDRETDLAGDAGGLLDAFLGWAAGLPDVAGAETPSDWHAACRRLVGALAPAFGRDAIPSAMVFSMEPSRGPVPALGIRVRPPDGPTFAMRVDSPTYEGARGFLCGRVRLCPEGGLADSAAGREVMLRVGRALLAVQDEGLLPGRWPETPPLLLAAWRRFGARLLPGTGAETALVDGEVLPDRVVLVFAEAAGRRVRVRLRHDPATGVVAWHVEGGGRGGTSG